MEIKIYERVDIKDAVMMAGWIGMGNVGYGVMNYLRRKLSMHIFAEIDLTEVIPPDRVIIEHGLVKFPQLPKNVFYYSTSPKLIVFEGEVQLSGTEGVEVMNKVVEVAKECNVRRIFTAAAFPLYISHKEESIVFGVANRKSLINYLYSIGVRIMEDGQITGMNGLLLGYGGEKDIEAACLLATIPVYAINMYNPKAVKAIIEVLQKILQISIDMMELNFFIEEMDKKMAALEDKMKGKKVEDYKIPGWGEEKVPPYIIEKIERLFEEAKKDRNKAILLKEELDRWDLYKLYEDKFLDLFKKET